MYWWWHRFHSEPKRFCWYPLTVASLRWSRWSNVLSGSLLLPPCLNPNSFTDPCSKMNCARGTGFLDDHLPGPEWQWNMPMCSNWGLTNIFHCYFCWKAPAVSIWSCHITLAKVIFVVLSGQLIPAISLLAAENQCISTGFQRIN